MILVHNDGETYGAWQFFIVAAREKLNIIVLWVSSIAALKSQESSSYLFRYSKVRWYIYIIQFTTDVIDLSLNRWKKPLKLTHSNNSWSFNLLIAKILTWQGFACFLSYKATSLIYVKVLVIVVKICYKFKYKSNM